MIDIYMLEQLKVFAEEGTLVKAAEVLNTSQPSLTRSMKRLEEELGVSVFTRSKNRLGLTETGRMAAEYASHIISVTQDFRARVRAYDRSLRTLSIGFCAPVPQSVLTPLINSIFEGMAVSSEMSDDEGFLGKLDEGVLQFAVMHTRPKTPRYFSKKIGHEGLYVALAPGSPLSSRTEVSLSDLDGLTILLLSQIGFWAKVHREKTPNSKYLLQVEYDSFIELATNSEYPVFTSSYYLHGRERFPDRIAVPISDPECSTDYYLVCLDSEKERYEALYEHLREDFIR